MSEKKSENDSSEEKFDKKAVLSRLFGYLMRYRLRILAGVLLAFMTSLTNLFSLSAFVPIFNSLGETGPVKIFTLGGAELERMQRARQGADLPVYERVSANITEFKFWVNLQMKDKTSGEAILTLCAVVFPVYIIKIFSLIGALFFIGTAGLLTVRNIRMELFSKMNDLGIDFFSRQKTGFIMSRIINDVELVGKNLSTEFNDALTNLFYIVTHIIFLIVISWKMFIITFIFVPILMSPVSKFAQKIRKAAQGQQERLAEMGAHVQEIIGGIRVIRAFSMQRFERQRFSVINTQLYKNTFRGHYYHQVGPAITEFVSSLVVLAFLSWGAHEMSGERLSRGEFFAFFFTLIFIMRPLKQISIMVNLLTNAGVAANRIFQFMDFEPGVQESPDARPIEDLKKSIVYKNVNFSYPGSETPSLHDINFTVEAGKTIALVGSSGAGKSTLVDILPRLYDVSSGEILLDGVNVKDIRLKDLRTSIGVVTQSIFLFNAGVKENISYGRTDISMERIVEVARAANAHEFIEKLPQGYDTPLGERGVMLSGGQRQRIAIARALLHDPPILIFDEATSALDNESEMLVQEAIERLLTGRTVFIIAHRLSTVYKSDEIFVLDQGRIVERGRHEELLENGQIYKKLYEMQFAE